MGDLGGRTAAGGARRGRRRPRRSGRRCGAPSSCRHREVTAGRTPAPGRGDASAAAQRRTVRTLVAAQAVGAIGITIGIATASLLARDLSGSDNQAGLAQTFQVLGAAVASYLLARLMSRRGRRVGLVTGYLLGAGGAVLAVLAGVVGSMPLLLVGAVLLGSTTAANSGARYAATDLAPERHRGPGAVDGGVGDDDRRGRRAEPDRARRAAGRPAGHPRADRPVRDRQPRACWLAPLVVGLFLRPDPLLLAREAVGVAGGRRPTGTSWGRAVGAVRERPVLAWAVLGLAAAHAVMVAVMVMTPLHMEHGGARAARDRHRDQRARARHVRVLAAGRDRRRPLRPAGGARHRRRRAAGVAGAVRRSPEGSSWQIFAGLFLLGLGWSFATVAASTTIADHAPLDARTDVQGAADLVMGLTAAGGGRPGRRGGRRRGATSCWPVSRAARRGGVASAVGSRSAE